MVANIKKATGIVRYVLTMGRRIDEQDSVVLSRISKHDKKMAIALCSSGA